MRFVTNARTFFLPVFWALKALFSDFQCTDDVAYGTVSVTVQIVVDAFGHFRGDGRIGKLAVPIWMAVAPASRDSGRPSVRDTTQTYYRNVCGFSYLPYHARGDGFHGCTTPSSGHGRQDGSALFCIDGRLPSRGVDGRHAVGSGTFYGTGNLSDVCHVGRQFYNQCLVDFTCGTHHFGSSVKSLHRKPYLPALRSGRKCSARWPDVFQFVDDGSRLLHSLPTCEPDIVYNHVRMDALNLRIDSGPRK